MRVRRCEVRPPAEHRFQRFCGLSQCERAGDDWTFWIQIYQMLSHGFETRTRWALPGAGAWAEERCATWNRNAVQPSQRRYGRDPRSPDRLSPCRHSRLSARTGSRRQFPVRKSEKGPEPTSPRPRQAVPPQSPSSGRYAPKPWQALPSPAGHRVGRTTKRRAPCRGPAASRFRLGDGNRGGGTPAIRVMRHLIDAAGFSVKAAEGSLLPNVTASAGLSRDDSNDPAAARPWSNSVTIGLR